MSTQKILITSTVNCEKKTKTQQMGTGKKGKKILNTEFIGLVFSDGKQIKISA